MWGLRYYTGPKWARQRLRLYGAQDRALEQFFNKLEEDMAELSIKRHNHAKQLVVFFGAASIGTAGGWGADAVLRACRKVVCRPRGTDQPRGRVVLVDEHRTTRVSSAVNGKQPCETRRLEATNRAGGTAPGAPSLKPGAWPASAGPDVVPCSGPPQAPTAPRSSQAATQPAASEPGPSTPQPAQRSKRTKAEPGAAEPTKGKGKGKAAKAKPAPQPGRWLDRDCNAALDMQRIGESRWRPLELCYWPKAALPAKGKEYPELGYKRVQDKPPKAQEQQQQQPAVAQDGKSGQLVADKLARWKLNKGQAKHANGLNNARRDTERWLAPIKPHLQHLAAASSAGTSLEANLKHITVTLATWDARLMLYRAQDRALEQFFKESEKDMVELSMKSHGHAKQLVVFICAASIGTAGGDGIRHSISCKKQSHCRGYDLSVSKPTYYRLSHSLHGGLKLPNYSTFNAPEAQLEHPAGRVPYTEALTFLGGPTPEQRIPAYRTLTDASQELDAAQLPHPITQALGVKMYQAMASLQTLDTLCYEAQRQGRMSFYLTSTGEEATVVGSAAALDPQDMVFAQGRQMPIHYGSRELCYQTISSPLATQMPHAVGAAYAMKLSGASTVAVAFFGEGAASEGDAHAALQFAATLAAPVLFICRNNGYAISTPASEQYKGDGIAGRAAGYGMAAVRVDGGDARAVYNAVAEARRLALQGSQPVLVECMSYRAGHHSTSDDSSRYRTADEMRAWRARDPVSRFRGWLQGRGWWDEMQEQALRVATRKEVMDALDAAAAVPKPPVSCLFTDVYKNMPGHLKAQASPPPAQVSPTQAPPPHPAQAQPLPAAPGPVQRPQAPPEGRWLDRDTNGCLNLQRIGESMQRPLELCQWKDLEALPTVGEEYQQRYKLVNDRLPKGRQRLHRAAEYRRGIDGRARNNA
ncbi:hypothetical protein QJQ45_012022 [Haematococcus lacustris]|nr:hypothetical protein QJQ45_012022 [Haematococcus lacustris]